MVETINQVQFPKVMIAGPSGFIADVNSNGQLLTTGGGAASFGSVTSGTNTVALTIGSGGVLSASGTGIVNATEINGVTITGTPSVGQVPTATSATAATWQTPSSGSASSLKLSPVVVLSGGTDAINPHTPATYVVTTAGVDAMTIAAPTVTTDDGVVIKVTTTTNAAHTITFTGGTLRPGTAAVTTANFASFRGSSIELMAFQGNWYVMAQNNIASYT